ISSVRRCLLLLNDGSSLLAWFYSGSSGVRDRRTGGAGIAPTRPPSKGGVLLIRRPGRKVVEPEVVATSPYPIKSRVPVCCGVGSLKSVLAAGVCMATIGPARA